MSSQLRNVPCFHTMTTKMKKTVGFCNWIFLIGLYVTSSSEEYPIITRVDTWSFDIWHYLCLCLFILTLSWSETSPRSQPFVYIHTYMPPRLIPTGRQRLLCSIYVMILNSVELKIVGHVKEFARVLVVDGAYCWLAHWSIYNSIIRLFKFIEKT